ncbi:MAG TPA: transposase [Pirellulales bacterium]|jgi:REP element-mobilizing transposase RayT|nr:transposase [Pirellulales bacterium]
MNRPVIGYHLVFGAYGFWLPNDPRGSWSRRVWANRLIPFGPPVPANTRRSRAALPHDRATRLAAKETLKYPPARFTGVQAKCIADAIAQDVRKYGLPVYAAAFMPDHVHLVIPRQSQSAEAWVGYFKRAASKALRVAGLHPMADCRDARGRLPSVWADHGWKVFLFSPEDFLAAIEYVEKNPIVAGLKAQRWSWITRYEP